MTNNPPRRRSARRIVRRPLYALPIVGIAVAGALGGFAGSAKSVTQQVASEGLICDWGSVDGDNGGAATERTFELTAKRGKIFTADGNQVPMWGYAENNGAYQYPSPFLCATSGDTIHVVLRNELGKDANTGKTRPTSIMFPGQTGVTADGAIAAPEFNGATSSSGVKSLVQSVDEGQTITYDFVAGKAGSYLYMSGTDTAVQKQMGLFGGLVVHPQHAATMADVPTGGATIFGSDYAGILNSDGNRKDAYGREYAHMLSEVDPDMHIAVNKGETFDMTQFRPRYWFINGRGMPDTLAPNDAEWLPSQPYSSLVHVLPYDKTEKASANDPHRQWDSLPVAIRYFNASTVAHPFHPHAADTDVIGIDAAPQLNADPVNVTNPTYADLTRTGSTTTDMQKYILEIAPGQTMDATWNWKLLKHPGGNGQTESVWGPTDTATTHRLPVPTQENRDTRYTPVSWYGGTPYLGTQDDLTQGVTQFNQCGEYYHVSHSHAVNEATTYGAAGGGMLTLYRIDPPGRWNCAK
jgi:FtsP/CotA-like multicopper oxidase with cupredoxin domain